MKKSRLLWAALVGLQVIAMGGCSQTTEPTGEDKTFLPLQEAVVFDFEGIEAGDIPDGFTAGLVGGGGPVRWEVLAADDAPSGGRVLGQLSDDKTNKRYPLLVCETVAVKDVDVSVKFKTLSGKVDASGGLIFRCSDPNNFYVVRANSLEGNVVAYKTENGKRDNIGVKGQGNAYGVEADVPHQQWNTLRVRVQDGLFEVFLNDKKLFEVENDTFTAVGKVGLWTKADAVTYFDDLSVRSLDGVQ